MDANQEGKEAGGKGCGCGGGHRGCCGAKALLVVLLFLVGGIIGYLMGQHCGHRHRPLSAAKPQYNPCGQHREADEREKIVVDAGPQIAVQQVVCHPKPATQGAIPAGEPFEGALRIHRVRVMRIDQTDITECTGEQHTCPDRGGDAMTVRAVVIGRAQGPRTEVRFHHAAGASVTRSACQIERIACGSRHGPTSRPLAAIPAPKWPPSARLGDVLGRCIVFGRVLCKFSECCRLRLYT